MLATGNRPVRRLTDNRIRSALCILALVLTPVGLAGCRSPLGGQAAITADLSLSFIVSGAERLARDAAAQRASSDVPGAQARLLLPTATSLSVTLTPEAGGDAIAADPVSIVAGAATVPVSLSAVPYGRYAVKAEAKDASGVARFTQTALLTVGDPELSVTLNLVPTDPAGAALAATTLHDIDIAELLPGVARTWLLAPGSRLLAARSVFLSGLGSDARVYLQAADGTFVSGAQGTGARLSTVNLPAEKPAYLTVYNGGGAVQPASRAFPGPAMVDVPAGAFQRDATATNVSHVSAFSMAALEVTRELYLAVMGADPSDVGVSTGSAHPVHRISWYQALAFCNKLSLLEKLKPVYSVLVSGSPIDWSSLDPGTIPTTSHTDWNAATLDAGADGYRLPRAMEWLWAAMGATSGSGYSGGVNTIGYSRLFAGSDGTNSEALFSWRDTGNIITRKAGSYSSNELGLYDMSGNVRELVWDWFESTVPPGILQDSSGPSINPDGQTTFRTWVGTCYNSDPWSLSMRSNYNAFDQHAQAGLRVARGSLPVNLRSGLVGEWLLDGDASDTSGRGAVAAYVATPTADAGRRGLAASAMRLDAGDSISIDAPAVEFSHSSSFSVSLWFNAVTTEGQYPYLLSELGVEDDFNYFISFNNGTINACVGQNNQGSASVNAPVSAGSWYHVVQVYNGAAVSLYLNGVFIGSEINTYHPTVHATTDLVLGGGGGGASFVGSLDDIRIYNRVLNNAEIQALYTE